MGRISLKEQYDNKDVIQQIYMLRDNFESLETETNEAIQSAQDAVATVGQYTERINRAETTANNASATAEEAKTVADSAMASISDASTKADTAISKATTAQTTADTATGLANTAQNTADNAMVEAKKAFVNFDYTYDSAQVSIVQTKGNNATVTKALPIANASQAGMMNAQTYQGITNLDVRVTALEGQARTYYVSFTSDNPSQSEITSLVTAKKGSAPITGDYAEDIARNQRYGYDGTTWTLVKGSTASNFTNDSAGLIKGSTQDGCIFAESDGTGSVMGWDAVKSHAVTYASKVDALETKVSALETSQATQAQTISGISTVANNAKSTADSALANAGTAQNRADEAYSKAETAQSTADSANTLAGQADSKADANASNIATLQTNVGNNTSAIEGLQSKQDAIIGKTVQLPTGGWNTSSKTQTVSVDGVGIGSLLWIGPDAGSWAEYGTCGVRATAQGEGTITFQCDTIPTGILTANVIIA